MHGGYSEHMEQVYNVMCMCVQCTVYVRVHVLVRGLTTHTVTFTLYTDPLRRTQTHMNWAWTDLSECVHCTCCACGASPVPGGCWDSGSGQPLAACASLTLWSSAVRAAVVLHLGKGCGR